MTATHSQQGPALPAAGGIGRWLAETLTTRPSFSSYFAPFMQYWQPGWSTHAWRATVMQIRSELSDVYSLVLKPDSRWAGFVAGQYVQLTVEKDGAFCTRTFSISSSPAHWQTTGLIELTIREQVGGRITPWLRQHLHANSVVNISAAQGEFTLQQVPEHRPLLLIAGGSGLTPLHSMLQQLSSEVSAREVHLLVYARDSQHFLFQQALLGYETSLSNLSIQWMDSEQVGFIDESHLQPLQRLLECDVFVCGPSPMIKAARDALRVLHVADERVHFEYFGAAPLDRVAQLDASRVVQFSRSQHVLDVAQASNQSLLEMAEQSGLNPVSGCRIGVCHQCICQKERGVVLNTRTGEYSDTGPEEIQLCLSVPVTDVVVSL